jgi:hypothetical protein
MRPHAAGRARAALVSAALCLAALATLGFPGCPEDPTGTGEGNPNTLTMSNCWPNDDGRYWNYPALLRYIEPESLIYAPPGQHVPDVTTELAKQLLSKPISFVPGVPSEYQYGMTFQGRLTSGPGVEAQGLLESYATPVSDRPAIASPRFGREFLERLAQARPDLRARLAAAGVTIAPASDALRPMGIAYYAPFFIHGGVWLKGPSWIGTYGEADTILAWKFLESNVQSGHSFRHQLVPSLADNIWLIGEVDRRVRIQVPSGRTVNNAIEVVYVIDYGVGEATDKGGAPLGTYRTFDYGRVTYAPGVGPVVDLERRYANMGQNVTMGYAELRLDLVSTGVYPPPAVVAAEKH